MPEAPSRHRALGRHTEKKYKSRCVFEGQGLILEGLELLGCLLGCLRGGLWLSWCLVGVVEVFWRHFGAILGASWAHLGLILDLLGLMLGSCWVHGRLMLGHAGAMLELCWSILRYWGSFGASCINLCCENCEFQKSAKNVMNITIKIITNLLVLLCFKNYFQRLNIQKN